MHQGKGIHNTLHLTFAHGPRLQIGWHAPPSDSRMTRRVLMWQKVDENPGDVRDSSADCMLDIIREAKAKAAQEKEKQQKAAEVPQTA